MKSTIISLLLLAFQFSALAQDKTSPEINKWGAEFNLVWPFVPSIEIYAAKVSNTLWKSKNMRGDLLTGLLIRPGTNNDPIASVFREFGLGLGYRQYLSKGFHVEFMLFPSYAMVEKNSIDGKDYKSFAMTTEFYTGYKLELTKKWTNKLYIIPQAGIGYNVYSRLGPETEANTPFPVLSLLIGLSF